MRVNQKHPKAEEERKGKLVFHRKARQLDLASLSPTAQKLFSLCPKLPQTTQPGQNLVP